MKTKFFSLCKTTKIQPFCFIKSHDQTFLAGRCLAEKYKEPGVGPQTSFSSFHVEAKIKLFSVRWVFTCGSWVFTGSLLVAQIIMIMRTKCILTKPVSDVYSGSQIVNIEPKRNIKRFFFVSFNSFSPYYFAKDIACDLRLFID